MMMMMWIVVRWRLVETMCCSHPTPQSFHHGLQTSCNDIVVLCSL